MTKDFERDTIYIVEVSLNYFPGLINQKATEELIGTIFAQSILPLAEKYARPQQKEKLGCI